jgi:hypothetical protein
MQDVAHWGVLTIGTGLGNARFTNRKKENGKDKKERAKEEKKDDKDDKEKKAKKAKA